jgi:hypothetical protein
MTKSSNRKYWTITGSKKGRCLRAIILEIKRYIGTNKVI